MSYKMTQEMQMMVDDAKKTQELLEKIERERIKEIKRIKRINSFGSFLMFAGMIATFAKLVLEIILKVNGVFTASVWAILCVGGGVLIPGGGSVSYIIAKNVGALHLSWSWIWIAIALDAIAILGFSVGSTLSSKEPKDYY